VSNEHDFEWTSRLRAYLIPGGHREGHADSSSALPRFSLEMRMGEAKFPHGLEYLGISERLVQVRNFASIAPVCV
jgi:hypothetical protein